MPARDPAYQDLLERVKAILVTLPREDLVDLRDHLDDLLPSEAAIARAHAPADPKVTRRKEWVRCGKPACRCTEGKGHGPYWYAYWREGGRLRKRYDGRAR